MKASRSITILLAGAIMGMLAFYQPAQSDEQSERLNQFKIFISTFVKELTFETLFPEGTDELIDVLENLPELTKTGLTLWLNQTMQTTAAAAEAAEAQGDASGAKKLWDEIGRYETFLACIASGRCDKLHQLFEIVAAVRAGMPAATFDNPRTDNGNFVDRCYAFASGCDDNDSPDPSKKPAANEFCKRKGYKSVAAGGSKWSYKAPTEILSSGEICPDATVCGGLDFVKCQ